MDSSLSSHMESALTTLSSACLAPRPHQVMFQSIHNYATRVGGYLKAQVDHSKTKKSGIFRRSSSSSKKKVKKDKKRSNFGKMKAHSTPNLEWDFTNTEPWGDILSSDKEVEVSLDTALAVFQSVMENVKNFVTTFAKTDKFVFHLASMRRMYLDLHAIGRKVDYVLKFGDLKEKQEEWEKQLNEDREKEEGELSIRAAKNALPFARNMMPHEPIEALTLLKFEIDYFKPGNSVKHVASMKKVFFSVVRSSNGRVAKIPDWYIPPYAMNYSREKVMEGSVGTAHRGVWVDRKPPDGKKPERDEEGAEQKPMRYKVVVKRLLFHADAIEFFRQEVEAWFAMDHPNILKLYGASHCSRPALLVLEDATNRSLLDYISHQRQLQSERRRDKRKHPELEQLWSYQNQWHALWSLFLEAARGLKYLHEDKNLVHSNLKSDNILVTADGQVKLTDFGLGILALQDQAVQDKTFKELGWRAPNCWQDKKLLRRPAFQDDIYSFGLCVLDVLVPELSSIVEDKNPNGPKHVDDEEFKPLEPSVLGMISDERHKELIVDMCKAEPEDRLTLPQVISRMEELRDVAARGPADTSECCIL